MLQHSPRSALCRMYPVYSSPIPPGPLRTPVELLAGRANQALSVHDSRPSDHKLEQATKSLAHSFQMPYNCYHGWHLEQLQQTSENCREHLCTRGFSTLMSLGWAPTCSTGAASKGLGVGFDFNTERSRGNRASCGCNVRTLGTPDLTAAPPSTVRLNNRTL